MKRENGENKQIWNIETSKQAVVCTIAGINLFRFRRQSYGGNVGGDVP